MTTKTKPRPKKKLKAKLKATNGHAKNGGPVMGGISPESTHTAWEIALAKRIAALRGRAGMSAYQASEAIGVSIKSIYAWEHGLRCIPARHFPRIAKAYGASAAELFPAFA